MSTSLIVVAGGTGNLGGKIVSALLENGAMVRVLARTSSDRGKIASLQQEGADVVSIDMNDVPAIAKACTGAACVVSALAGLEDVIIGTQQQLLAGAVAAGVPKFIPSDYSLDFTRFKNGENRNLDWRRQFHTYLDAAPIATNSVFNGAFMELLTNQMPMILFGKRRILYWGNADHKMAFTTVADTAKFTAAAALDTASPRYLRIAGDLVSPRDMSVVMSDITGKPFKLLRTGGLGLLSSLIAITKRVSPGKKELYPAWQGMQYMRNMMDDRATWPTTDNKRYAGIPCTTVKSMLAAHIAKTK